MQDPQLYKVVKFTSAAIFEKALKELAGTRGFAYILTGTLILG